MFIPALATERHGEHALRAARRILDQLGYGGAEVPWLPVGIGINTGNAYVGSVGHGMDTEMTAMGDAVNVTARLSSVARAGEILVPLDAAGAAGLRPDGIERRSLELHGKSEPIEALVIID